MRAQRSDSVGTVWGRAGIRRRVAFGASRRTFAFAALLVGAAVGCVGVQRAPTSTTPPAISYALEPVPATSSAEGYTRVRVTITGPPTIAGETPALRTTTERRLRLQMPVWTPGEYRVQNHARYVRGLRVVGDATQVGRPDHNTWDVSVPDSGTVEVRYELANAPPGIFTENVDVRSRRAFYSGPATFMYLPGRTQERVALEITAPPGWDGPITPLTADETPVTASRSAGVSAASDSAPASKAASPRAFAFTASTYDELADAPILIGDSLTRSFEIGGKRHRTTFMGRTGALDPGPYVETLRAIVRAGSDYMGGLPYPRYDLFLDVGGRGGGLEHANAARIAIAPYMPARAVARFMAHEYFHLWNVKRIRPAVLGPFDYANPPRTRDLWFCEGVTEYVAGLLALRAGLLDDGAFLSDISRSIGTLLATPARRRVTAETASLRIWDEGRSTGYGGLSVYLKGEMIGLCIDLELLRLTDGKAGLRELMHDLMERHAPPKPGYGEDGLREACIRIGGPAMGGYYDRLCRSTEELPIAECLRVVGLRLVGGAGTGFGLDDDASALPEARRLRETWLYGR